MPKVGCRERVFSLAILTSSSLVLCVATTRIQEPKTGGNERENGCQNSRRELNSKRSKKIAKNDVPIFKKIYLQDGLWIALCCSLPTNLGGFLRGFN
jgi:hypothetical protein